MENKKRHNEDARYSAEQRTVQILGVIKDISDENHHVNKKDIVEALGKLEDPISVNPGVVSDTVDQILLQINPFFYSDENDEEYRIKYNNYEEDIAVENEIMREEKKRKKSVTFSKEDNEEPRKARAIKGIRYIHDFSVGELDELMQIVSFSPFLDMEEKAKLMGKITKTASRYYSSPFYNKDKKKTMFSPNGIHSRLERGKYLGNEYDQKVLITNVGILQEAINSLHKVSLCFAGKMDMIVNPYYLVVYHERMYLIGGFPKSEKIAHLRIDQMENVTILKVEKSDPIRNYPLLPTKENWDPEKYMSEHMYVSYDEPRRVKLKITKGHLHWIEDWFGKHYKVLKGDDEYDRVEVNCSPSGMVHWAMQYGRNVIVEDEEIREKIREELEEMKRNYQ